MERHRTVLVVRLANEFRRLAWHLSLWSGSGRNPIVRGQLAPFAARLLRAGAPFSTWLWRAGSTKYSPCRLVCA